MIVRRDRDGLWPLLGARTLLLIALSLLLIGVALLSLHWSFGYDTAQMLYYGRLIAQLHFVPYRDIFEENLPGAILAYTAIGSLIDYSNPFLLRLFDLAYLTAISLATWRWLRPLGGQAAWAAVALFGLVYLLTGPGFTTQREYIFLLPLVVALAVATSPARLPDTRRALVVGLLFGLATTIKPHAGIGLLPAMLFHYFDVRARLGGARPGLRTTVETLAAYGAGVLMPVAAVVAYLAISGGLPAWLQIVTRYWPLYATTTANLTVLTGLDRLAFIAATLVTLGGQTAWLIPAACGVGLALWPGVLSPRRRRRVALMVGLVVCYALYPALTGQFYPQHWLPMTYFLLCLAALCFLGPGQPARWPVIGVPLAAIVAALVLSAGLLVGGFNQLVSFFVEHQSIPSIDGNRAAEIAAYLEGHLQPGDTVQSLDAVGYAMHGMLIARAVPATRFQADAPFYTQADAPYIQALRAEFIDALTRHPPRFIIDVVARVRLRTDHKVTPFPELSRLMQDRYTPVYIGHGFLIYERASASRPGVVVFPSEASAMSPAETLPLKADVLTFASGRPAASPAAVDARLTSFSANHDRLIYENLGDESESASVLDNWLNRHAYRLSEQQNVDTRLVDYLSPRLPCDAPQPTGARFGEIIHLSAAAATVLRLDAGQFVCIKLVMDALQAPERNYLISAHVFDPQGHSVAQYDSQPVGNLSPTTTWQPGQPIADQFAVRLPTGLPSGDYQVALYISDVETREMLKTAGGAEFALIATLNLGQ